MTSSFIPDISHSSTEEKWYIVLKKRTSDELKCAMTFGEAIIWSDFLIILLVFYSNELNNSVLSWFAFEFAFLQSKALNAPLKFIALWNCDFFSFPSSKSPPSPPLENILSINSVQPSFCGWMVPLSVWAWLQTAEYWKIASGCVRQHTYCRTPWGAPDCLWSTCLKDREWMMHCLCVCVLGRCSSTVCVSHVMAMIKGLTLWGSKSDLFREHKLSIPLGPSV